MRIRMSARAQYARWPPDMSRPCIDSRRSLGRGEADISRFWCVGVTGILFWVVVRERKRYRELWLLMRLF